MKQPAAGHPGGWLFFTFNNIEENRK